MQVCLRVSQTVNDRPFLGWFGMLGAGTGGIVFTAGGTRGIAACCVAIN